MRQIMMIPESACAKAAALALLALLFLAAPVAFSGEEAAAGGAEINATKTAPQYDPAEIIKKMEELMRGDSNYSEMKMTISNPEWPAPRVYAMKSWEDRKNDKSFIRITEPATERGKAFLKAGNVFKVYIPTERENKPITIPPSLMLQPWMGSDFSNDDLVHESSMIDDYDQVVEGVEQDAQGVKLIKLRLDPKPAAAVVWGKIVVWVRAEDFIPVREVYYDEDGVMIREMTMSQIKEMSGRKLPTVWEMKSLEPDKKGRKTVLELDKIEFDVPIDPSTFTDKNLTRRDWE